MPQVEARYESSRLIFYRESAARAYRQLPFALSMVLAEMPYSILCAVGFFLPLYYMPRFQSAQAGYQLLMVFITEVFSVTLGQMMSALTPNSLIAMLLNPFLGITMALFCGKIQCESSRTLMADSYAGVTVPKPQIPKFWRDWLYELDPFTRLSGMIVTELHGRQIRCEISEYATFNAPPGQTCGSYMADYFKHGALGYLADNATTMCQFCIYNIGDDFYTPLGLSYDNRWRDMGIYACFIASNLVILFIAVSQV